MRFDLINVLLVDDNPHMRTMLTEILRAVGIRVVFEAADGSAALQMLRVYPIDLVLTDLAMAPLDGLEMVRLIRTSPDSVNPEVPIIMISGHSTARRVTEARDAGVNGFLGKPISARGVIEQLGEVIDHPRPFVRGQSYAGPCRRRRQDPDYAGPFRRVEDKDAVEIDA